jgi:hypothetical protein
MNNRFALRSVAVLRVLLSSPIAFETVTKDRTSLQLARVAGSGHLL